MAAQLPGVGGRLVATVAGALGRALLGGWLQEHEREWHLMRISHDGSASGPDRPTVDPMTCCWPGALPLGCDLAGHWAVALLLRAGWHEATAPIFAEVAARESERRCCTRRRDGPSCGVRFGWPNARIGYIWDEVAVPSAPPSRRRLLRPVVRRSV